jgi:hypothetical protein
MILLFTIGGRTGNQLFQLAYAISRRKRKEWLLTIGFGSTRSLLAARCKERWLNIEHPFFRFILEQFLFAFLYHAFVRTRLVSSHLENNDHYTLNSGKIRFIRIMKGYFQSSKRQSESLSELLSLKESLRASVRPMLLSISGGRRPVFVHLRRTDFEGVMIGGKNVQLPDVYYLNAVRALCERNSQLFFVIVGDDPNHAELLFHDLGPKYISRLPVEQDLALMSLCEGGVLSNSNFAWWGAFLSRGRLGFVAPKYWSGWRVKSWYPPELRGDFVTQYIDL